MEKNLRPIAIYLPQFHPIPENDEWWGKGFTEWANTSASKPRFKGHYQPHLPADLGYYDLRLPETRQAQVDLARQYGVEGFCYYHYWFNGRRILERPFQEVFDNGQPDFPFMLCWANENWTREWDGSNKTILLSQTYHEADDINHIRSLIPYFKDNRYIKVDGKPVFSIYSDAAIPNMLQTIATFRRECEKEGIELYLMKFERETNTTIGNPEKYGFEAAVEFQPKTNKRKEFMKQEQSIKKRLSRYLQTGELFKLNNYLKIIQNKLFHKKILKDSIIDYNAFVDFDIQYPKENYKLYPGVCPGWDNSSRRPEDNAQIFINSTPEKFGQWVKAKREKFTPFSKEENFLFINAWNEWAEGNHLEPCKKWGLRYLEVLKEALK